MAHYVERQWTPAGSAAYGLGRKDTAPGIYRAYVPDELGVDLPALGDEATQAAAEALVALGRADERLGQNGAFLAHLLIRSESISSSWIEGNHVTPKKLAIAEALHHGGRVAIDVIGNVRATERAVADLADPSRPITIEDLEELQHVIEPRLTKGTRTEQVFVGGTGYSPLRADFVPPPEGEVRRLLGDLARFVTETRGNPVVRAAIAHAQFETIHPFSDGNGRTGRAIIHTVLKRGDALRNVLIPISTVFAGATNTYIDGLTAFRSEPPDRDAWVTAFSEAVILAAQNALQLADDIAELDRIVLEHLIAHRKERGVAPASPRADSTLVNVLRDLASEPVLTIEGVRTRYGVSRVSASKALGELQEAGILARVKDQKGNLVCFTADDHLALVSFAERSNRVGAGDTRELRVTKGPPRPQDTKFSVRKSSS